MLFLGLSLIFIKIVLKVAMTFFIYGGSQKSRLFLPTAFLQDLVKLRFLFLLETIIFPRKRIGGDNSELVCILAV